MKPQKIQIASAKTAFAKIRNKKILLLASPSWLVSKAAKPAMQQLKLSNEVQILSYSGFYLKFRELEKMRKKLKHPFQVILAIGGGGVLDLAKHLLYDLKRPTLIAVPTTAGSGSEATQFATFYRGFQKHSLSYSWLRPQQVIFVSEWLLSIPPSVRASAGLDCLSQAIESILSKKSTPSSRRKAFLSLKIFRKYFEKYLLIPNKTNAKQMQRAAYASGCAIQISQTNLAHALSYELTRIHGIPHGKAVFLNLIPFLRYNYLFDDRISQKRLKQIFMVWNCKTLKAFEEKLKKLAQSCEVSLDYSNWNVSEQNIKKIYEHAGESPRARNSLHPINVNDLKEILQTYIKEIRES